MKPIIKSEHYKKATGNVTGNLSLMKSITCLAVVIVLCSASCKDKELQNDQVTFSGKRTLTTSAQPLPGGKARFSWVHGNFDTDGTTRQRIVQLTFNASAGTVAATVWNWESSEKKGKAAFNSHVCTFDGITKTVSTYTPWGWVYPTGQYESWAGTYTYSGTTLTINWDSPSYAAAATEKWTITPKTALARASFISSNYSITHGRGYGSNASFSTYKTIDQIPATNFTSTNSRRVTSKASSGTANPVITPSTPGNWTTTSLNLSTFHKPSSPNPKNTMHYHQPTATPCDGGSSCTTTRKGIIYHLSSQNNSRHMAYHFFCACLPTASEFPGYPRNLHPVALTQILDDNNNLVALIGVESQNPPEAYYNGAYQYQLLDFNNIP